MPNREHGEPRRFFIGANAAGGFVAYGSEITRSMAKIYIIKGGPGTGKSTFMKRLAADIEEKGHPVDYYYCSSDSRSLDGIVCPGLGIAVVDGTAPHTMEANYPGAVEELIDLGAFWDGKRLTVHAEEIRTLCDAKAARYVGVYKYLGVGKVLRDERNTILSRISDEEKADKAMGRLIRRLGNGNGFAVQNRQISAIGMQGRTVFNTYEQEATEHWQIADSRGLSGMLFEKLLCHAERAGLSVWLSRDPMQEIEAIYFPEKGVSVVCSTSEGADRILNTERFVCRERLAAERTRLRFLVRLEKELLHRVEELFAEIRRRHFALESLYVETMDFDAVEERRKALLSNLPL